MSGYEKSSPSKVGGGVPGRFEVAYGNTMKGGELRKIDVNLKKPLKQIRLQKQEIFHLYVDHFVVRIN